MRRSLEGSSASQLTRHYSIPLYEYGEQCIREVNDKKFSGFQQRCRQPTNGCQLAAIGTLQSGFGQIARLVQWRVSEEQPRLSRTPAL